MALYRYSMGDRVSRGTGGSAVRAAAYLARGCYEDQRTGWVHDFSGARKSPVMEASDHIAREGRHAELGSRQEVLFSGLYAPANAPDWCVGAANIERFWNAAEAAERRRDAQIAERFIIAIPSEFTLEQAVWAIQDHVREFTRQGRVVQVAIHSPEPGHDQRNLHAHLLVSLRGVDEHGLKARKFEEQQERFMNRSAYVEHLRENWAHVANRHLARHGHEVSLDHRSYQRQGLNREPELHMGPGDAMRERQGIQTAVSEHNRAIRQRNAERERQALDQTIEARHAESERTSAIAKVQTQQPDPVVRELAAAGKWQELNERNLARKRAAAQQVEKHGAGLAPADSAKPASRPDRPLAHLSAEELEKEAHAAWTPSWSRPMTVEDMAREISPAYRTASARLEAANKAAERAGWNRYQTEMEMEAALGRVDEAREKMSWWGTVKHVWSKDYDLAYWRGLHKRSIVGYKQAEDKEFAALKEQERATKDANRAYDQIKQAAGEEFAKRLERQAAAEEEKRLRSAIERSGEVQARSLTPEQDQAQDLQLRTRFGVEPTPEQDHRAMQAELAARSIEAWIQQTLTAGRIEQTAKVNGVTVEAIKRLHENSRLDMSDYRPTTVEDVARQMSPAFAEADDRARELRQQLGNMNTLIDATENSLHVTQRQHEQHQRQMSMLQVGADLVWRNKRLFELEEQMGRLSAEHEVLIRRAPALGHSVSAAEHTRAVEFEKIRKPAQEELTQRQETARHARAELAAYRAQELAIERAEQERLQQEERQQYRQSHQHRRGLSLRR